MTTEEIIAYYVDLLIMQYHGKPKASGTIEALVRMVTMEQLPLAVQNAFTVGDTFIEGVLYPGAVGTQLDVLGKYAGVARTGYTVPGVPITLDDIDFTTLIKVAILKNFSGSSLADIQNLLYMYFPNQIFVFDGANMQMSYLISSSVGNQDLIEILITEGLLPKPMGVLLSQIVYIPSISLFGYLQYNNLPSAWSALTTYARGSRVFENGIVYSSLVNNNLNHAVTNSDYWIALIYPYNTYDTYPDARAYTWLTYDDTINIL